MLPLVLDKGLERPSPISKMRARERMLSSQIAGLATLEEIRVFQRDTSQALKVRKYPISCPSFWKQESQ
jgi:hypothetical protein